jgi:uncharacterized membrane protein YhaH (DUF805 family)
MKEERTSRKAVWALILTILGLVLTGGLFVVTTAKFVQVQATSYQSSTGHTVDVSREATTDGDASRESGPRLSPQGRIESHAARPPFQPTGQTPPAISILLGLIPLAVLLTGNALGISALKDIRTSEGKLGGKASAVFAAGMVPGILLVAVAAMGFMFAGEELMRGRGRRPGDIWPTLGATAGIGLAFLLFRRLSLYADGWKAPADSGHIKRSASCSLALCFTVTGAALALVTVVMGSKEPRSSSFGEILAFISLAVLLAGTISGVQARGEPAGRTSACLSAFLFVALVFLAFS